MTARYGLRRQVRQNLADIEGCSLPGQHAFHPRVSVFPEAGSLPNGKEAIEAGEEFEDIPLFGVDALVEVKPVKFGRVECRNTSRNRGVRRSIARFNRGVQGKEPLGESLVRGADLLETLRTRNAP